MKYENKTKEVRHKIEQLDTYDSNWL